MASNYEEISKAHREQYGTDVGRYGGPLLVDRYDDCVFWPNSATDSGFNSATCSGYRPAKHQLVGMTRYLAAINI